mmetsp:Transcript_4113/g.7207  ORF Transcript_4113/g.7207 Transcript_4113/m.7207 type:complete len:274 (+) Transcript_4113:702-1523(+)
MPHQHRRSRRQRIRGRQPPLLEPRHRGGGADAQGPQGRGVQHRVPPLPALPPERIRRRLHTRVEVAAPPPRRASPPPSSVVAQQHTCLVHPTCTPHRSATPHHRDAAGRARAATALQGTRHAMQWCELRARHHPTAQPTAAPSTAAPVEVQLACSNPFRACSVCVAEKARWSSTLDCCVCSGNVLAHGCALCWSPAPHLATLWLVPCTPQFPPASLPLSFFRSACALDSARHLLEATRHPHVLPLPSCSAAATPHVASSVDTCGGAAARQGLE